MVEDKDIYIFIFVLLTQFTQKKFTVQTSQTFELLYNFVCFINKHNQLFDPLK